MSTAACLGVLLAAMAFAALRLGWAGPAGPTGAGGRAPVVYQVAAIPAVVRVGAAPAAPPLGEVQAHELLAPASEERAPDGWIHVRGRDWQGWVAPADLQGPYQRSTPARSLAPLTRLPEL